MLIKLGGWPYYADDATVTQRFLLLLILIVYLRCVNIQLKRKLDVCKNLLLAFVHMQQWTFGDSH